MSETITIEYKKKLEQLMDKHYKYVPFSNEHYSGEKMYLLANGNVFHIDIISSGCLCIEYADSRADADNFILEDGDSFLIDEYKDAEEMLKAMLKEIRDEEVCST